MESRFRRKRARKSFGLNLDPLKKRLSEREGVGRKEGERGERQRKNISKGERKTEGLDRRERPIR